MFSFQDWEICCCFDHVFLFQIISEQNSEYIWRIGLGLGAIPSILIFIQDSNKQTKSFKFKRCC